MTDKGTTRPRRTGEELVAVWEQLLYEIQMLFGTARALHTLDSGKSDERRMWAIRNALTESFSIHAHVLRDFLYLGGSQPDDVLAEDFFDNVATWIERRPEESSLLRAIHARPGEQSPRMPLARFNIAPESREWDIVGVARDLRAVLRAFLALAPGRGISDESQLYALSIMADEIPGATE
ncbi:MAG: hypothetical protein Q8R28_13000 [Dehalococcoidia bacterium]|nr:hypothetical protein [Dehalococcoidia bacterium]